MTAIGVHDGLTARLADMAGFEAVYVGSFAAEAAYAARPDVGLMTREERLHIIRGVRRATDLPLVADMDEGFGDSTEVAESMRAFEDVGVNAVHLDDQQSPATCPWFSDFPRRPLLDPRIMADKIGAATAARRSSETLVIARADLVAQMGVSDFDSQGGRDLVVARSNFYRAAGADAIFVMARAVDELEFYRRNIDAPLMAVFAPMEPLAIGEFDRSGYDIVIGSIVSVLAVAKTLGDVYRRLQDGQDWNTIVDSVASSSEFAAVTRLQEFEDRARAQRNGAFE